MYEIYIKFSMNPFYEINKPIISPAFEKRSGFWQKISTNITEKIGILGKETHTISI